MEDTVVVVHHRLLLVLVGMTRMMLVVLKVSWHCFRDFMPEPATLGTLKPPFIFNPTKHSPTGRLGPFINVPFVVIVQFVPSWHGGSPSSTLLIKSLWMPVIRGREETSRILRLVKSQGLLIFVDNQNREYPESEESYIRCVGTPCLKERACQDKECVDHQENGIWTIPKVDEARLSLEKTNFLCISFST